MGKRGPSGNTKLAAVCTILNKSELELAHALGLSLAALKSIDRPDPPLYLTLALAALIDGSVPELTSRFDLGLLGVSPNTPQLGLI